MQKDNYKPPTVVNKYKSKYDVYIGRGSKWGNPFPISETDSREDVIDKYKEWFFKEFESGNITEEDVLSLTGKRLGCYCSPKPCHGDFIVEVFNIIYEKRKL